MMGRRSAHCVLARPELAIPAKNDKADISAAEREKDNHSRKMPCTIVSNTIHNPILAVNL